MASNNNFNSEISDILKEVSNIGSGNAVTALAKLMKQRVNMKVPIVRLLDFDEISNIIGEPDDIVVGMIMSFTGDISGAIMYVIPEESAIKLVKVILQNINYECVEFDEIALSALKETTNIIGNAYITALSKLTGFKIHSDVPFVGIDMAAAILSVPAIQFAQDSDKIIYLDSLLGDSEISILGNILLIPESGSYKKIAKSLGANLDE